MIDYENLGKLNAPFVEEYEKFFSSFVREGWYILGQTTKRFEENFAKYLNAKNCIGVASGLDALTLSIRALDLPKGSEILVPSNNYIASILSILECNCIPVLVEPDIRTYNIDPKKIEEKITSKTRALLLVHLYGKPCAMDPIFEICKEKGLALIEDCAQSHGAKYKGKMVGTFGDFGAWSFYPTKNLGALGDAGAITTESDEYALKLRALRNYGSHVKYENKYIGMNSRLDEVQSGFLDIKLKALDKITAHKQKLAAIYHRELKSHVIKPLIENGIEDVYHIYNIRHEKRDLLKNYLLEKGIKTEIHYPIAPHHQECMKGVVTGCYPISEEIHRTTLSLPISTIHSEEDVYKVCECINSFK